MRYCPQCHSEYVDKKNTCADCHGELVDILHDVDEDKPYLEYVEMTYLTTASSEMNANMLTSLLESFDINTMRKYREAGGYLTVFMGDTSFGTDIFVDQTKINEAVDVIKPIENAILQGDEQVLLENAKPKWKHKLFIIFCLILYLF
ncbi:hypothetical protein [Salipaludibacillus daqingensis]|uniref:hypothetical protein n=1 Tax=Salipaludibacillus daqingensis TaxID=3041001 RepID=UPI0024769150|nr:hypothetical protein [Salipaludibacillus daqingensis]